MNYAEELKKAEERLKQGEIISAAFICGRILETALREIYNELLPKLLPEESIRAIKALENLGKGKPVDELTLGQLVGIFREAQLVKLAEKKLGRDLSLLENHQLVQTWVELRNRAAHGKEDISAEEVELFYHNLAALLQRARLVTPPRLPVNRRRGGRWSNRAPMF